MSLIRKGIIVQIEVSSGSVTPQQLAAALDAGASVVIIDVRRPPAFDKHPVRIADAVRVLPDNVADWCKQQQTDSTGLVIAYCVHGHEVSQGAAAQLNAGGLTAAYLVGGVTAWESLGYPVVDWS